jgi:hypothetical protein
MAKSRVRESTSEIADEIERKIRKNERAKLDRAVLKRAKEMQAYAVSISPEDTGEYIDSFEINRVDRDGLPGRSLSNTDPIANIIEYGSNDTPEFGVLGRTAHAFGGTVDH